MTFPTTPAEAAQASSDDPAHIAALRAKMRRLLNDRARTVPGEMARRRIDGGVRDLLGQIRLALQGARAVQTELPIGGRK